MILNKKKREDALKRITAVSIIVNNSVKPEYLDTAVDNLAEIAFAVGGIKGMRKVDDYFRQIWLKRIGEIEENEQ